jgi:hypothetical protein
MATAAPPDLGLLQMQMQMQMHVSMAGVRRAVKSQCSLILERVGSEINEWGSSSSPAGVSYGSCKS